MAARFSWLTRLLSSSVALVRSFGFCTIPVIGWGNCGVHEDRVAYGNRVGSELSRYSMKGIFLDP